MPPRPPVHQGILIAARHGRRGRGTAPGGWRKEGGGTVRDRGARNAARVYVCPPACSLARSPTRTTADGDGPTRRSRSRFPARIARASRKSTTNCNLVTPSGPHFLFMRLYTRVRTCLCVFPSVCFCHFLALFSRSDQPPIDCTANNTTFPDRRNFFSSPAVIRLIISA